MKNAIAYSFICLSLSIVNAEKDKEIKVHIKKYKHDPNDRMRLYIEQLEQNTPPHSKSERILKTPDYLFLLENIKEEYNTTWTNIYNLNERLNDHFRMFKVTSISNAKRFAFLGASFMHHNICKCMLRVPCINQPIDKEPLTNVILEKIYIELDNNLNNHLKKFDPNIFRTIYLPCNKLVNTNQHQKRIRINSNPTFVYLQEKVSATLICPRYPKKHIPVIWAVLVKGRDYTIEFPNH